jgi:hypothetical protein
LPSSFPASSSGSGSPGGAAGGAAGRPTGGWTPRRPKRSAPRARAVGDLLDETDALAALRAGIRQATALERDLVALLPDYLAPHVSVGTIKGETLTIFAGHSALAARLRHLERGLIQDLQQRGWPVGGFRVKVRPVTKPPVEPKQAKLSAAGIDCLQTFAGGLEASPLRDALERMLARHPRR